MVMNLTKIDPDDPLDGNKWDGGVGWIEVDSFFTFGDNAVFYNKDGEHKIKLSESRIALYGD